jgi:glutaredoxin 3
VPEIVVYTADWCGFCSRATALLEAQGVPYREIPIGDDPAFRQRVFDLGGRWTVPLVLVDGRPVGGYQELAAAVRSGRLADLIAAA